MVKQIKKRNFNIRDIFDYYSKDFIIRCNLVKPIYKTQRIKSIRLYKSIYLIYIKSDLNDTEEKN